jgi:hypothetical protein
MIQDECNECNGLIVECEVAVNKHIRSTDVITLNECTILRQGSGTGAFGPGN